MTAPEWLVKVQAAHVLMGDTSRTHDDAGQCTCAEKFYEIGGTPGAYLDAHRRLLAAHAAHVAAAVWAEFTARAQQAREDVAEAISLSIEGTPEYVVGWTDEADAAVAALLRAMGGGE